MKRTLKSLLFVVFLSMLLFVLTGCANVNYEIKLDKDGSGDVSYIIGYDKSFLSSMQVSIDDLQGDDTFDEMKQEAIDDGYTVESYEDDNTYGFKAYKHVDNIQNEFQINEDSSQSDAIQYEKKFLTTKYSQDATLDLSDLTGDSEEDAFATAILGQMKISYKIVLPFKVGDNNATTVSEDGKTLEWILTAGQTNQIKFTAEEDYTMYAVAGVCILVVLIILLVILVIFSRRSKKQESNEVKTVKTKKEEPKTEKKQEEK